MDDRTKELIEAINNSPYEWRSYSGRFMYGESCVGVDLDSTSDLWKLAQELALAGIEVDAPKTDSMGLGIIAYWPRYELTKEDLQELRDKSDDDDSDEYDDCQCPDACPVHDD